MTIRRSLLAVGLLAIIPLVLFIGRQIPMCLGPLGVTPIGCYDATGTTPSANLEPGFLLAAALVGVLAVLAWPTRPGRRLRAAAITAAPVAAICGVLAYDASRPRALEGLTRDAVLGGPAGTFVSLPIPFEPSAALAAALLAAATVLLAIGVAARLTLQLRGGPSIPRAAGHEAA